jgi:hypothetical protein
MERLAVAPAAGRLPGKYRNHALIRAYARRQALLQDGLERCQAVSSDLIGCYSAGVDEEGS